MAMPWRFSSAVQRPTQVPQAPSRPNRVAISRWYDGRLSSVSRLVIIAALAVSESRDCSGRPVLTAQEGEVAALAPRDVVVGVPLLRHPEVAVEILRNDRLQRLQQMVRSTHRAVPRFGCQ